MIYSTKYNTTAQYNAVKANLIKPHVALTLDDYKCHYSNYNPYNGHEFVDLGLPSGTKWATMNVGASSETEHGNYYQYGKGAAQYSVTSGDSSYDGIEEPLAASVDTAVQVWGGAWHTPTKEQLEELTANTVFRWEEDYKGSGIRGAKFTAPNGKYLFFPTGGRGFDGTIVGVRSTCYCWGASPNTNKYAYWLSYADGGGGVWYTERKNGIQVRPVIG